MSQEPSANAKWAAETVTRFSDNTGATIAIVVVDEQEDHTRHPYVALAGNTTDAAIMIRALVEMVVDAGRPESCVTCAENYDALCRARAELDRIVGRC